MSKLSRFKSILAGIAPLVVMLVPGAAPIAAVIPIVIKAMTDAEDKPHASGPEKREYVVAQAENAANIINTAGGRERLDVGLVKASSGEMVDAIITAVNAVEKAREAVVKTDPNPGATTANTKPV